MERDLGKKIRKLGQSIQKLEDALAALPVEEVEQSLLRVCRDEFSERAVAATLMSDDYPKEELSFARRVTHVVSGNQRPALRFRRKKKR